MKSFLNKIFGGNQSVPGAVGKDNDGVTKKKQPIAGTDLLLKNGSVELRANVSSKKLYITLVAKDDFTGEMSLRFKNVASYGQDKLFTWTDERYQVNIGFRYEKKQDWLIFSCYQKEIKLNKEDRLSFLFADGEIIDFELVEKGYRIDKDSDGVMIESLAPINGVQMEKFASMALNKWRFIPKEKGHSATATPKPEIQKDIREMASVYKSIVNQYIKGS